MYDENLAAAFAALSMRQIALENLFLTLVENPAADRARLRQAFDRSGESLLAKFDAAGFTDSQRETLQRALAEVRAALH